MDGAPRTAVATTRQPLALTILCLGALMVSVDTNIVNVALQDIGTELHFSEDRLLWVVNGYITTFAGLLLLAGRLGDLLGHRRVFLAGISLFTAFSLACGLAPTAQILILARALQGLAGAAIAVQVISLIAVLFEDPTQRARALGVYAVTSYLGASGALLLGGALTSVAGWRGIFLVNIPIGLTVAFLGPRHLPHSHDLTQIRPRAPLIPRALFKARSLYLANTAALLSSVGTYVWFFIYARFLQTILHYDPFTVGLAYLPANMLTGVVALGLTPRLISRWGTKWPLILGFLSSATGLFLLAGTPLAATGALNVFPGMCLLGIGMGLARAPLTLSALDNVPANNAGVASGIITTTGLVGGVCGLALLGDFAQKRGYRDALILASLCLLAAALVSAKLSNRPRTA